MRYSLLIVFLFYSHVVYSISNQELLLQGHQLYEKKEFAHALDAYKTVSNKGSSVWYNMGNCAHHLKQFDDAQLYWLKAYKNADKKQRYSIKKNMQVLKEQVSTSVDVSIFDSVLCNIPLFFLQLFLIGLWCVLLWLSVRWYRKKKYFLLFVFTFITGIVAIGVVLKYRIICHSYAILMDDTELFAGPNANYHTVGSFKRSSVVAVCTKNNNWCKIQQKKVVGWVPLEKLVEI